MKTARTSKVCPRCGVEGPTEEVARHAREVAEAVFRAPQPRIMKCSACEDTFRVPPDEDEQ